MIKDIDAYILSQRSAMLAQLEELVLIQSGTFNKAGTDAVARRIEQSLRSLPVRMETIAQDTFGNHLVVHTGPVEAQGRILLVGHMDTVFPADTDFNWYREDEHKCYGPGVCDMKGGLVVGMYAMRALSACGLLEQLPVTFVFNSDEEIGSPSSKALIRELAGQCCAAFVLECGGKGNEIVTGRKGNLTLRMDIAGEAGHAAFAGIHKGSALLELAHKTIALEGLNDPDNGCTVNVGKVVGGIGSNTVAEAARAWVDCRFQTTEQKNQLQDRIQEITGTNRTPGTQGSLEVISSRPPMPPSAPNKNLYRLVQRVARQLNQSIGDEYRQGVSDANQIAETNVPVVDGLGPVGGKDHSEQEYMIKDSLMQRTVLLAHCIVAVHRDGSGIHAR